MNAKCFLQFVNNQVFPEVDWEFCKLSKKVGIYTKQKKWGGKPLYTLNNKS